MAFNAKLRMIDDGVALITLSGELDGQAAADFKKQVEAAADKKPKRLILLMKDLEYMASAGLRVLIFAKQKMGNDLDMYIVSARDMVLETIKMTGFHHSVILLDEYDAAVLEKL